MASVIRGNDNFDTADNATQTELNVHGLGIGQTWQDMTASRAVDGTQYTNDTGKPIMIHIFCNTTGDFNAIRVTVDGIEVRGAEMTNLHNAQFGGLIIPNGSTYSAISTVGTLNKWLELR